MLLSELCVISGACGEVKAYSKVNLTLDVTGIRPDGYHNILTIMRSVNLYDTITAELTDGGEIVLTTDMAELPTDSRNIAYRGAEAILKEAQSEFGVKIHIAKKIPCGAGMGGGSADGAAVIALVNRLLESPVSEKRLYEIGASIGADVPFCLMCGTALASGIGEKLEPIFAKGRVPILIVKPEVSISTPEMYKIIDSCEITKRPNTKAAVEAVEAGNIQAIADNLCNVMEAPAVAQHGVIDEIRNTMLNNGARGAMMTGSGSAVFGIFNTIAEADLCAKAFNGKFEHIYSTVLL